MKPEIIKDEILDILESLKEQIPVLINYNDKIPQIELDIVLSNLRKIYENINELKNIDHRAKTDSSSELVDEPEIITVQSQLEKTDEEKKINEPESVIVEIREEISEDIIIKSKEESIEINEHDEKSDERIDQPVREGVRIVFETKEEEIIQPKKREIQEKTTIDLFSSSEPSVSDKFKNDSKSINEKLNSDTEDQSIAAKMQKGIITDLKLAIGLNEKFLFINELFDGNMKEYSDAIDRFNNHDSLNEAKNTFEELKSKYNWNESSDAFIKLLNLIERRF